MIFAILVQGSPGGAASSLAAYRFAETVLAGGHSIARVFFYGAGAAHASAFLVPPAGAADLPRLWQTLAAQHNIELLACIGSALRCGVLDEREAARHDLPTASMREGFELAGLGQLVDATLRGDRLISFGG